MPATVKSLALNAYLYAPRHSPFFFLPFLLAVINAKSKHRAIIGIFPEKLLHPILLLLVFPLVFLSSRAPPINSIRVLFRANKSTTISSRIYHFTSESPKFEYFLEGGGDEKPDNTEDGDKEEREYLGGRTSLLLFGNRLRVSRFALRFLLLLLLSNSSSTLPSPSSTGLPREQLVEKQLSAERACRASAG